MNRNRALHLLVSLKALANDTSTTEGERQAARERIAHLREKYDIPEISDVRQRAKNDAVADANRRAQAAEAYRQAQTNVRDHNGMTAADREWARRDPIGFAASRDTRTQAEKQRDMQNSFGQRDRWRAKSTGPRCSTPYTFFDNGGEPRSRNKHRATCQKCKCTLEAGEGCITVIGVYCCEMAPGPRQKNSRSTQD